MAAVRHKDSGLDAARVRRDAGGWRLPLRREPHPRGMRAAVVLVLLVAAAVVHAADGSVDIVVSETITGSEGQGGDQAELERIEALESERIRRARAELPRLPPSLARIARQDIGTAQAELERVVVSRGGTVPIGERRFHIAGSTITVEDGSRRLAIDLAARTVTADADGEPQTWKIPSASDQLKIEDGKPGPVVLGRATLKYTFQVDGRDHRALVDPTLPNPYQAWRQDGTEPDPLVPELARLPGFPLVVEQLSGKVVLRLTAVSIK